MELDISVFFGWIAVAISVFLYCSLIPKFCQLCKHRINYNDTPNLTVLGNYINCLNWLFYGYLIKNIHILACFLSGSIISIICVVIYLYFLAKVKLSKAFLYASILLLISFLLYVLLILIIGNVDVVGWICVTFSLLPFVNPILTIAKVVKYRNYKFIPINLVIARLMGAVCWIIYGFMIIDIYIVLPNFIGLVFSLILMFIWNIFKKRKPISDDVTNTSINKGKGDSIVVIS